MPHTPPHAAFLGTGLLGSALVEAAARRGERLAVWNRTAEKARALAPLGVAVADTPADAARGAARVHLVLRDDPVVDEVVEALRPGLAPDAVIVDHTTTEPARTAERAARLAAEGVRYLHCPCSSDPPPRAPARGPSSPRARGRCSTRRAGARAHGAARRVPRRARRTSPAVHKLCGNAFVIGLSALVADVFAVAGGAGVAPADALRALDFLDLSAAAAGRGRRMAAGRLHGAFELMMARKDVRLMVQDRRPQPARRAARDRHAHGRPHRRGGGRLRPRRARPRRRRRAG
jgi:3-hydroxyisobutyrate dehydrogenase-like beta-hydroxyacid dehydrogenase